MWERVGGLKCIIMQNYKNNTNSTIKNLTNFVGEIFYYQNDQKRTHFKS